MATRYLTRCDRNGSRPWYVLWLQMEDEGYIRLNNDNEKNLEGAVREGIDYRKEATKSELGRPLFEVTPRMTCMRFFWRPMGSRIRRPCLYIPIKT